MQVGNNAFNFGNAIRWNNNSANRNQTFSRLGDNTYTRSATAVSAAFRDSVLQLTGNADAMLQSLSDMRRIGESSISPAQTFLPVVEDTSVLTITAFDESALYGTNLSELSIEVISLAADSENGEAQNAVFRINYGDLEGELQTSQSNDIDLGFGITARLAGVGAAILAIVRSDSARANSGALRNLVNSYNGMVSAATQSGSGSSLERSLTGVAKPVRALLSRLGISFNPDNTMRIDESRMNNSVESGTAEQFSSGEGLDFVNRLTRIAERVSRNPAAFVSTENAPASMVNPAANFSPMYANQMAKTANAGMMLSVLH